jgi:hypothetical protein
MATATKRYEGAALEGGRKVSDAHRVAHEAAASYVGSRAAAYYDTQVQLENLLGAVHTGRMDVAATNKALTKIERDYNAQMAERQFGYDEVGGEQKQVVGTPISNEMKDFLDAQVLDGRVADKFADVAAFGQLRDQIQGAKQ